MREELELLVTLQEMQEEHLLLVLIVLHQVEPVVSKDVLVLLKVVQMVLVLMEL